MKFDDVLRAAITDILTNGFNSEIQLMTWLMKIQSALQPFRVNLSSSRSLAAKELDKALKQAFSDSSIAQKHSGINKFTLERLRPNAQRMLEERIKANANLIILRRDIAINDTLSRFSSWAISGAKESVLESKKSIKKPIAQADYIERRQLIDQGHKLNAAINESIAKDGGAIAMTWYQHWTANPREKGHDAQSNHKQFNGKTYIIKDSWAVRDGLLTAGNLDYLEDIGTMPSQEINCVCTGVYIYSMTSLYRKRPDAFTQKALKQMGKE